MCAYILDINDLLVITREDFDDHLQKLKVEFCKGCAKKDSR
jgi:hypothetical protein